MRFLTAFLLALTLHGAAAAQQNHLEYRRFFVSEAGIQVKITAVIPEVPDRVALTEKAFGVGSRFDVLAQRLGQAGFHDPTEQIKVADRLFAREVRVRLDCKIQLNAAWSDKRKTFLPGDFMVCNHGHPMVQLPPGKTAEEVFERFSTLYRMTPKKLR